MSASDRRLESGIAFALLAAGSSRRFGGGKLGVDLGGKPLLRWAAESAVLAGFTRRLLVVANTDAPDFGLAREGWELIVNRDADSGMASSIRAAAEEALGCERLVIGLADMPFVSPAHLRTLASADDIVFTRYPSGRSGVPAAFAGRDVARLVSLRGDQGAASIGWKSMRSILPPSETELLDIDTAEDLARARRIEAMRR